MAEIEIDLKPLQGLKLINNRLKILKQYNFGNIEIDLKPLQGLKRK